MSAKETKLKRYVVCESGTEQGTCDRRYVVEVPNGVDVEMLNGERLSEAADEAGVGWEMPELDGPYHEGYVLEGLADEVECDGLPVISMAVATEGRTAMISDELIEQRAIRAYSRRFGPDSPVPSSGGGEVIEKQGKLFVELENVNGHLATYRVMSSRDGGFRLKYVS